jgi:hypothetical protein
LGAEFNYNGYWQKELNETKDMSVHVSISGTENLKGDMNQVKFRSFSGWTLANLLVVLSSLNQKN